MKKLLIVVLPLVLLSFAASADVIMKLTGKVHSYTDKDVKIQTDKELITIPLHLLNQKVVDDLYKRLGKETLFKISMSKRSELTYKKLTKR